MRRMFSAVVALFVMVGMVAAGTYTGMITAVSKDEVKITVREKGKKGKGEEKVIKAKDLKFTKKGKDGDTEIALDDVTKAIEESKGKVKGVFGTVTTDGEGDKEVATKVSIGFGGKKKKDK